MHLIQLFTIHFSIHRINTSIVAVRLKKFSKTRREATFQRNSDEKASELFTLGQRMGGRARAKEKTRATLFNAYLPQAACHSVPPFRETKINYCPAVFVARRGAVNPPLSLFSCHLRTPLPPSPSSLPLSYHHLPNIIF